MPDALEKFKVDIDEGNPLDTGMTAEVEKVVTDSQGAPVLDPQTGDVATEKVDFCRVSLDDQVVKDVHSAFVRKLKEGDPSQTGSGQAPSPQTTGGQAPVTPPPTAASASQPAVAPPSATGPASPPPASVTPPSTTAPASPPTVTPTPPPATGPASPPATAPVSPQATAPASPPPAATTQRNRPAAATPTQPPPSLGPDEQRLEDELKNKRHLSKLEFPVAPDDTPEGIVLTMVSDQVKNPNHQPNDPNSKEVEAKHETLTLTWKNGSPISKSQVDKIKDIFEGSDSPERLKEILELLGNDLRAGRIELEGDAGKQLIAPVLDPILQSGSQDPEAGAQPAVKADVPSDELTTSIPSVSLAPHKVTLDKKGNSERKFIVYMVDGELTGDEGQGGGGYPRLTLTAKGAITDPEKELTLTKILTEPGQSPEEKLRTVLCKAKEFGYLDNISKKFQGGVSDGTKAEVNRILSEVIADQSIPSTPQTAPTAAAATTTTPTPPTQPVAPTQPVVPATSPTVTGPTPPAAPTAPSASNPATVRQVQSTDPDKVSFFEQRPRKKSDQLQIGLVKSADNGFPRRMELLVDKKLETGTLTVKFNGSNLERSEHELLNSREIGVGRMKFKIARPLTEQERKEIDEFFASTADATDSAVVTTELLRLMSKMNLTEGMTIENLYLKGGNPPLSLDFLNLRGVTFKNCILENASMVGADLSGAIFDGCTLSGCRAQDLIADGLKIVRSDIRKLSLQGAELTNLDIDIGTSILKGLDLRGAKIKGGPLAKFIADNSTEDKLRKLSGELEGLRFNDKTEIVSDDGRSGNLIEALKGVSKKTHRTGSDLSAADLQKIIRETPLLRSIEFGKIEVTPVDQSGAAAAQAPVETHKRFGLIAKVDVKAEGEEIATLAIDYGEHLQDKVQIQAVGDDRDDLGDQRTFEHALGAWIDVDEQIKILRNWLHGRIEEEDEDEWVVQNVA